MATPKSRKSSRSKTATASAAKKSAARSKTRPARKKPAAKTAAPRKATKPPARSTSARATAATSGPASACRRAIFIDVENTSNEDSLSKVIDLLRIDRAAQPTEFFAVGNWRAVGLGMSRYLARLGASLVHSAPVTGVRDWSDLWIAVAAGRWIALATPGDMLDIVSNDKAFEAVGDMAASNGIIFRRVPHKVSAAAVAAAAAETDRDAPPRRRRRRGGRGRRRGNGERRPTATTAAPRSTSASASRGEPRLRQEPANRPEPASRPEPAARPQSPPERAQGAASDGHGASHEQIIGTIRRLTGSDPNRWVNLDAVANALKEEGFTRPPGSTRLVVRLRRMKNIEVQSNGLVRLVG